MNKYSVKLELTIEIEAFDQDDAKDYVLDMFGTDDEVKSVKTLSVKLKGD